MEYRSNILTGSRAYADNIAASANFDPRTKNLIQMKSNYFESASYEIFEYPSA